MIKTVLRWVGPLAVAFMVLRLTATAARPIANTDVFFHLRLGAELGAPWHWHAVEHWSRFATADWVPTQALSEVLQHRVELLGGLPAVAWLYGLSLIGFVLSLYVVLRERNGVLGSSFAVAATVAGAAPSLSARPMLFSLILLVWVAHLWRRTAEDLRPRWILVPLFWLWAMVHGYWVVGLVLGATVVGMLILTRRARGQQALRLVALGVACAAAVAVTPLGPKLLLGPLIVTGRSELISEWQRTDLTSGGALLVAGLLSFSFIVLWAQKQLDAVSAAIVLSALAWVVYSERTVHVAAVLASFFLAKAIDAIREDDFGPGLRRWERPFLAGMVVVPLTVLAFVVPHTAAHEADSIPAGLDEQLSALPAGTVVFGREDVSGWLAWRYPDLQVAVDGMFDAYEVGYLKRTRDALLARDGWEETLADTGSGIALLKSDSKLAGELERLGWSRLGTDAGYVLLDGKESP